MKRSRKNLEKVLENKSVLSLFDKETKQKSAYFTTKEVRAEEEKLLRFTDAIAGKAADALPLHAVTKGLKNKTLTDEQKKAYDLCTSSGQNLELSSPRK